MGSGVVLISTINGDEQLFSEHFACVHCGISLSEIEPRTFSFNSPHGACSACSGLGTKLEVDPTLLIPNDKMSIAEGAIVVWGWGSWRASQLEDLARCHGFSVSTPINRLTKEHLNLVLHGENSSVTKHRNRFGRVRHYFNGFEGVIPYLERLYKETQSNNTRAYIERFMSSHPCPDCNGKRLRPESLAVTIDNKNIIEVTELSAIDEYNWIDSLMNGEKRQSVLTSNEFFIGSQIFKEISTRLKFLIDIGLGYLTLDRASSTLSGGETQRIRLATQIGSGLMGVLYICDEPTIGLH
jgi:excinuclease ABC subunit A